MILHGYWRSGAAYRVRIGLNLKGLTYDQQAVELRPEHHGPLFFRLQAHLPAGHRPALRVGQRSVAADAGLDNAVGVVGLPLGPGQQ